MFVSVSSNCFIHCHQTGNTTYLPRVQASLLRYASKYGAFHYSQAELKEELASDLIGFDDPHLLNLPFDNRHILLG